MVNSDLEKRVIISGVNLTEGGILSILQDCLYALKKLQKQKNLKIILLIHDKKLLIDNTAGFEIYEYPKIKSSWFRRLYFEYWTSKKISEKLKPDLWISLHDITPNVACDLQVVYCHNSSSFYDLPLKEAKLDFKFYLFNKFYKYLYQINIKRNKYVIVQQEWFRRAFEKQYGVECIVAYPELDEQHNQQKEVLQEKEKYIFFYPSFPRVFKNFETLLEAGVILGKKRTDFRILITMDGSENKYSEMIRARFSKYTFIEFIGLQPREKIYEFYNQCDCLVFPSKLETWGLPISEAKLFNKPILVADLPYAHETIGNYDKVRFFDPKSGFQLAAEMENLLEGCVSFDKNNVELPKYPFFSNWHGLLTFLLTKLEDGKK